MNRLSYAAAVWALSGLIGCAPTPKGFAQVGASPSRATEKERSAVAGIELEAGPERSEVLSGEPLYVRVSMTNLRRSPVQAPSVVDTPPWVFRLEGRDAAAKYQISARGHLSQLQLNYTPPDESQPIRTPETQTLRPMSRLEYRIDLQGFVTEPIAPGKYNLTAEYRFEGETIRSVPIPLAVVAPNVTALASLRHPEGTFASAFLHQASDGSSVLYQRESLPRESPGAVAYSRVVTPPGRSIDSFALGWPGAGGSARWIGWIEGDAIHAALGEGDKVWAQIDATSTKLRGPVLARPAHQLPDGHVVFFAHGLKEDRPFLHRITLKSQEPPAIAAVELPSLPQGTVLARYVGTTLFLVWSDRADGRYALKAVACSFGGGEPKGVERALVSADSPILAFDLSPLGATPGDVDVLLGAADGSLSLEYRRVPLVGGRAASSWKLPDPGLKSGEQAAAWAVLAGDADHAPVALLTATRLLNIDARSSADWKSREVAAEGRYLTLFRVLAGPYSAGPKSSLWATWADRQTGMRHLKID